MCENQVHNRVHITELVVKKALLINELGGRCCSHHPLHCIDPRISVDGQEAL
jgi:hypothetical protein